MRAGKNTYLERNKELQKLIKQQTNDLTWQRTNSITKLPSLYRRQLLNRKLQQEK